MEHKIKFLKPRGFSFDEDWTDVYLEVKNIRKGDVFFECVRGENYKLVALTNARRILDGWYCVVENNNGKQMEIFYSDYTNYPAPNLFREPQYLTEVEQELVYLIA
jgi:hypothetical protein